jgi:hypothetical protein
MIFKSFKTVKICLIKIRFLARKLCVKILFCNNYFRPLNTFMRKGKNPELEPDPYLRQTDPDADGIREAQKHTDPDADPEHWVTMYN